MRHEEAVFNAGCGNVMISNVLTGQLSGLLSGITGCFSSAVVYFECHILQKTHTCDMREEKK